MRIRTLAFVRAAALVTIAGLLLGQALPVEARRRGRRKKASKEEKELRIWHKKQCPEKSGVYLRRHLSRIRIPLISPYEVKRMLENEEPVYLIDVRSPLEFGRFHLAGAHNVPHEEVGNTMIPSGVLAILYCTACCCPEIPVAVKLLLESGNRQIAVLRSGLEELGELVIWRVGEGPKTADMLIDLPCGAARKAVKALTEKMAQKKVPPIEFQLDSARLRRYSKKTLNRVGKILLEHKGLHLKVVGHTCEIGTDEYNLDLSVRRAARVKEYLNDLGVEEFRVESEGVGENFPIASNDDEEFRKKNRRVEFFWKQPDR